MIINSTHKGHTFGIAVAIMILTVVLLGGVASADSSTSPIHVDIYIQNKTITLSNSGEFSVTILSTNGFDAKNATTGVNIPSVRFEGVASFNANFDKVNNLKLMFHSGSDIQCGNSRIVYLTGKTKDERDIVGWVNNVTIVGCNYPSPPGAPNITSFAPPSPVTNNVSDSRTFNISVNQTVDVIWYINGIDGNLVQSNVSVTESKYTNNSASPGIWNVTVVANNGNGTDIKYWDWIVSKANTTTNIISDSPDPSDVGQPYTVSFTVNTQSGEIPTGNAIVSDGTDSCTASVAAGSCSVTSTTAGLKTLTATYSGDTNFSGSSGTATHQVNKANQTITFGALGDKTYGDPSFTVSAIASSGLSVSFTASGDCTVSGNNVTTIGAGSCTITANQSGNASYNPAPDVSQSFNIAKAPASISLSDLTQTYDGYPKSATATTNPLELTVVSITYDGSLTPPINAGSYAVVANLMNANYEALNATDTLIINKASQTISFDTLTNKTYGDAPFMVNATASSRLPVSFTANGTCTISDSNVTITGASTCTITAYQAGDANYNAAPDVQQTFSIVKATASITVTNYSVTYDGDAHTATVIATGAKGEDLSADINLSGTTHTNAGDYPSDEWTFTDSTGYYNSASGTVHDSISKIDAIITVNGYTGVYDGNSHGASGTATGVGGTDLSSSLDFGSEFTNVPGGTAHWTFTGGTNYNGASGDVNIEIIKANPAISITPYSVIYDGNAHSATVVVIGAKGEDLSANVTLTGTTHTNAGDYPSDAWAFIDSTGNYNSTDGTVHDSVDKADPIIAVTTYSVAYDGNAHTATGTATGVKGEGLTGLDLSGTTHTDTGIYSIDAWKFTDTTGNYNNESGTVSDSIGRADQIITFGALDNKTYGDAPFNVSATASSGLPVSFTANGTCTVSDSNITITGASTCDITTHQAGDANYNAALDVQQTFSIAKATASITVTGYSVIYDGNAHTATGTATGANGESLSGLDLSGTTHTNAGDYLSDTWTFTDTTGNYNDESGTLHDAISKATLTVTANDMSREYGEPNPVFTASYSGFKNEETLATSGVTGSPSLTTTADPSSLVSGSPYTITAASGTLTSGNYEFSFVNGNLTITKAETTTSLSSSINPSVSGKSVNFTATVSAIAPGAGIPNGTVQFKIDGTNFGLPVGLSNGSATSIGNSSLSVGTHSVTAEYGGDGNFNSSTSSALTQTVNTASTTTTSSSAGASTGSSGCGSGVITKENLLNIKQYETREVYVHMSEGATVFSFSTLGIVNKAGFTAKTNEGCIAARGEVLKERPSQATSDAPGTDAVYFNVWLGPWGYGESSKLENPYVVFSVPDEKNNESVKLMMYKDNSWIDLKTEKIDTGTYRAYTRGFGSFAIVETATANETPYETSIQSTPTPVVITNEQAPQKPTNLALILVVFILIIGMVIGYRQYRKGLSRKNTNLRK